MPKNDMETGEIEAKKIWTKQLNKFFSDYFEWVVVLVVGVVFIFGLVFLLLPKYAQTVRFVEVVNKQEQLDYQVKSEELIKIKQLIAAYGKIDKKYIDKVNSIAPLEQNKEELFSEINYLVSRNQLFLQSISLSAIGPYQDMDLVKSGAADSKIAQNIQAVSVSLSVKGTDYNAFKTFLASLENNLRLMDVVSVTFDPAGRSTGLVINTYYQAAKK